MRDRRARVRAALARVGSPWRGAGRPAEGPASEGPARGGGFSAGVWERAKRAGAGRVVVESARGERGGPDGGPGMGLPGGGVWVRDSRAWARVLARADVRRGADWSRRSREAERARRGEIPAGGRLVPVSSPAGSFVAGGEAYRGEAVPARPAGRRVRTAEQAAKLRASAAARRERRWATIGEAAGEAEGAREAARSRVHGLTPAEVRRAMVALVRPAAAADGQRRAWWAWWLDVSRFGPVVRYTRGGPVVSFHLDRLAARAARSVRAPGVSSTSRDEARESAKLAIVELFRAGPESAPAIQWGCPVGGPAVMRRAVAAARASLRGERLRGGSISDREGGPVLVSGDLVGWSLLDRAARPYASVSQAWGELATATIGAGLRPESVPDFGGWSGSVVNSFVPSGSIIAKCGLGPAGPARFEGGQWRDPAPASVVRAGRLAAGAGYVEREEMASRREAAAQLLRRVRLLANLRVRLGLAGGGLRTRARWYRVGRVLSLVCQGESLRLATEGEGYQWVDGKGVPANWLRDSGDLIGRLAGRKSARAAGDIPRAVRRGWGRERAAARRAAAVRRDWLATVRPAEDTGPGVGWVGMVKARRRLGFPGTGTGMGPAFVAQVCEALGIPGPGVRDRRARVPAL